MNKKAWIIPVLCTAAFCLRLAYAFFSDDINRLPVPGSDQSEYELYAWNMANGRGFSGYSAASTAIEAPTSFRAPLPSIIYSLIYRISGRHPAALRIINIIIDAVNVYLIFLIARALAGWTAGVVSAAAWCLYPMALFLSADILSEAMAILLLCLHLLLLIGFSRHHGFIRLIGSGLLLGLLILTKAEFMIYLPMLIIWLIWRNYPNWGRITGAVCLISGACFITVMPWSIRNYLVHGEVVPVSTGGGETLLQGNNDYVVPGTTFSDPSLYGYNCSSWGIPEYREMFKGMNEVERDRAAQKEAVRWLMQNKHRWPWLIWAKTKRHWTPFMQPHSDAKLRYAMLLSYGPILMLALPAFAGTLVRGLRRKQSVTLLHLLVLFVEAKAVLFFGYSRYRFLADPALIILAAVSLAWTLHALYPWLFRLNGDVKTSGCIDIDADTVRKKESSSMLSIVMPVYNEINTIKSVIDKVKNAPLHPGMSSELIIVDDASCDGTRELLKELEQKDKFILILHSRNRGKGSALRTGFKEARGDVILVQDADLEYSPDDYMKLTRPILDGETKVVYGSRIIGRKVNPKGGPVFYLGGRFLSVITNLLYGTSLSDEPTCYKVFDAQTLKNLELRCQRFEFCPEVTAMLALHEVPIQEVPISYLPRTASEGKKITWKDGIEAVWTLLRFRFARSKAA